MTNTPHIPPARPLAAPVIIATLALIPAPAHPAIVEEIIAIIAATRWFSMPDRRSILAAAGRHGDEVENLIQSALDAL